MARKLVFLILFLTVFLLISCSKEGVNEIGNQEENQNNDDILVIDITKEENEVISNLNMIVVELVKELNDNQNKYYFDDQVLKKDEIILLVDETSGLQLKESDLISIEFQTESDISKTKLGYFLDGNFTEIPYESMGNTLNASIEISKDGDYTICIMNTTKDSTIITNGNIIIK